MVLIPLENGVIDVVKNVIDSLQTDKLTKVAQKECNESHTIESVKNNTSKPEIDFTNLKTSLDNMYMDQLQNKVSEEMYGMEILRVA